MQLLINSSVFANLLKAIKYTIIYASKAVNLIFSMILHSALLCERGWWVSERNSEM